MKEAEKALKPYQVKLHEADGRLHQQEVQNQARHLALNMLLSVDAGLVRCRHKR